MYHLNTFKYYKNDYQLNGSSGEGVSWRNVFGNCVLDILRDENNMLAAGVYTITIDADSYDAFYAMLGDTNIVLRGEWVISTDYVINDVVIKNDITYRCIQAHNSDLCSPPVNFNPSVDYTDYWEIYYNIEEVNTLSPILCDIISQDIQNVLSPSISRTGIAIDALSDEYQPQVVSGLKIKFSHIQDMTKKDKCQIIVGGKWVAGEDRFQKDLLFGRVSANGSPILDPVTISIQNNSGAALSNIRAKIVNKMSIYQTQQQNLARAVTIAEQSSPYYGKEGYAYDSYMVPHQQPFQSHPLDLIVPMTDLNTPAGIRSFSSAVGTVYQNGPDISWTPFSRGWTAPALSSNPFPVGWDAISYSSADDALRAQRLRDFITGNLNFYSLYGPIPVQQYFNCLRYDCGQGNFMSPNVIGLSGIGIGINNDALGLGKVTLYGSQDNIDVPQKWEMLIENLTAGNAATPSAGHWIGGQIVYSAFYNGKSYRHFMVDITQLSMIDAFGPTWGARIEVMELLRVSINDYVTRRDRPFLVINQNGELNPQWSAGEYPKDIKFRNAQYDGISIWFGNPAYDGIDMRIDEATFDVYEVVTGTRMPRGEKLKIDGITQYRMSDDSPYPGFVFTLSSTAIETDSAELYVSPGADVFEIRLDNNDTWKSSGEKCSLSDTIADQATLSFQIRPYPISGVDFDIDAAVEGLIQICGEDDDGDTHLTSIPLAAVVSRQFTPLNLRANFIDQSTRDALYEFGITEIS